MATKKHCYNCLGEEYRATACKNKKSSKNCNVRYYTLICEKGNRKSTPTLTTQDKQVIHPMVILKVSEIKCRALLDTGAGSAYPSATLIENINKRLSRTEYRKVEMMVPNKNVQICQAEVSDVEGNHSLGIVVSKFDKSMFISLPNTNY